MFGLFESRLINFKVASVITVAGVCRDQVMPGANA